MLLRIIKINSYKELTSQKKLFFPKNWYFNVNTVAWIVGLEKSINCKG